MHQDQDQIDALLLDNRFVDWVLNPQSPYAGYWLHWVAESDANAMLAEEAKGLVLDMHTQQAQEADIISDAHLEQMLAGIKAGIAGERKKTFPWRRLAAIAATVLVAATGLLYLYGGNGETGFPTAEARKTTHSGEVVRYNGDQEEKTLFLPDGSKVMLAKGARIAYNLLMEGDKREITLTGDAFFDVAKNPDKPFYIYTPNVVVKVLGTSFRVTASGKNESVAVRTGKVSVYLKGQDLEQSAARIVLPQQVCKFVQEKHELITEVFTGRPFPDADLEKSCGFMFDDAPVVDVMRKLEQMYAVPIRFNPKTFENCYITISLGNESLEEILKVITRTIDASYSMSTYGISIEGKGCR